MNPPYTTFNPSLYPQHAFLQPTFIHPQGMHPPHYFPHTFQPAHGLQPQFQQPGFMGHPGFVPMSGPAPVPQVQQPAPGPMPGTMSGAMPGAWTANGRPGGPPFCKV
ncbi:hypothetical protein K491DRAFT_759298 [Lophiostoma macrostomum CBS 122681]|uniref:Uncharacterized protein n=1 Tax=Lophiostoma macrostomum CBS 122681 TaxID=1314788 RepID=A0A6A6T5D8_9PLEO|nr:hypothetical protein K491DRAFT_759298 [Lophiostoma macrostomum CBS 122681]